MDTKQKNKGANTRKSTGKTSAKQPETRQRRQAAPAKEEVYRPQQRRSPTAQNSPAQKRRPNQATASNKNAQRGRASQAQRRRRQAPRRPTPAVVHTQPMVFNRNRLLMQLLTVTACVLAVVMALSIFFKVEVVTVSGANVYSEWTIWEASGIEEGDRLLTFSRARANSKILAELPYVKQTRIGIKLPNTVNIIVEEYDVYYSIQSADGMWWLITSGGKVLEQTDGGTANTYTKVLGITLESPTVNEQAVATGSISASPGESSTEESTAAVITVTGQDRLNAALQILQALEQNDIVGEAASVDVSDLTDIILWYGTQYEVELGDTSRLVDKIAMMKAAINSEEMKNGYGVLDVTLTYWTDMVGYTPFE